MADSRTDLDKLRALVDSGDIAMLTTLADDGQLEARPMTLQDFDDHGRLWFFTEYEAPKAAQLKADPRTLVTFSSKNYVSIQGTASVVQDPARQRELWNKAAQAWLQSEPTDPKVALIVVDADGAEFWETPGIASGLLSVVTAAVKGDRPEIGTNERMDL
ncbi:MAG: pyridoxamine 5'-phosphate oxidase family protein [Propionicimonas sp.]